MAGWLDDGRPFLVAERGGQVVGFARVAPYSPRPVYAGVGEHAVYVAREARGTGLGTQSARRARPCRGARRLPQALLAGVRGQRGQSRRPPRRRLRGGGDPAPSRAPRRALARLRARRAAPGRRRAGLTRPGGARSGRGPVGSDSAPRKLPDGDRKRLRLGQGSSPRGPHPASTAAARHGTPEWGRRTAATKVDAVEGGPGGSTRPTPLRARGHPREEPRGAARQRRARHGEQPAGWRTRCASSGAPAGPRSGSTSPTWRSSTRPVSARSSRCCTTRASEARDLTVSRSCPALDRLIALSRLEQHVPRG